MSKSINWAARIAKEENAAVRANLRTKLSDRKQYKVRGRSIHYIAEVSSSRTSLGNGNSITRNLTPSH